MNRIKALKARYSAVRYLVNNGVEIVTVGDHAGARLNTVVRELLAVVRTDDPDIWNDLLGAVKALRWRRVTQPQPAQLNPATQDIARQVEQEVVLLREPSLIRHFSMRFGALQPRSPSLILPSVRYYYVPLRRLVRAHAR